MKFYDSLKEMENHPSLLANNNAAFQRFTIIIDTSEDSSEVDFRPSRMSICIHLALNVAKDFFNRCAFCYISLYLINDSRCIEVSKYIGSFKEFESLCGNISFIPSGKCILLESVENTSKLNYTGVIMGSAACIFLASIKITGYSFSSFNSIVLSRNRINCVSLVGDIDVVKRLVKSTGGFFLNYSSPQSLSPLLLLELHRPKVNLPNTMLRMCYACSTANVQLCSCHGMLHSVPLYKCSRCLSVLCTNDTFCPVCFCFVVAEQSLISIKRSMNQVFSVISCKQGTSCNICENSEASVYCSFCECLYCQSCYEIASKHLRCCLRCSTKGLS